MPPLVIWSHGLDAAPWGAKSKALRAEAEALGATMDAVDYQGVRDPDERVRMLVARIIEADGPVLLAGSSMGGYASAAAAMEADPLGLFLLAPAFYFPGYAWQDFPGLDVPTAIIHGWRDEVVPVERSIRFAGIHRADLRIVDGDHRLSGCLEQVRAAFRGWLRAFV